MEETKTLVYRIKVWFETDRFLLDHIKHTRVIESDHPKLMTSDWDMICRWCVEHGYSKPVLRKYECLNSLVHSPTTDVSWYLPL